MTIALGGDHAGYAYKAAVIELLEKAGHKVLNFGTDTADSVDYPDFVHPTSEAVESKKADFGILFCGSGNGVAMTANKHQGIRCAMAWGPDLARLAREHNDANMMALPCRFISQHQALQFVELFINTAFEGGRHERRVNKIACV
ncbi:MAG: RpiB/LacA/LacB family sugar-phosphate isomerase [Saprospiraceae bacterium]|nr:RpiB/LacA/LacB family sugar-phosphate isomerase [Saprospiraceae bacterium]